VAINYFLGWSQEDLLVELRNAQEDLSAGKSTVRAAAGDLENRSVIAKSAEDRIKLILKSLNALDPITYPIDQVTAITMTKAAFS
jgi:predicted nucleic acid-binding protein